MSPRIHDSYVYSGHAGSHGMVSLWMPLYIGVGWVPARFKYPDQITGRRRFPVTVSWRLSALLAMATMSLRTWPGASAAM
jgi:hypothetical protein